MKLLRRTIRIVIALVAVIILVLLGWYAIDGQPLPETAAVLEGEGFYPQTPSMCFLSKINSQ